MGLQNLSLKNFRNFTDISIKFDPSINLIYGPNGSGKTNLLEAIHLGSQGSSFRNHRLDQCIQHDSSSLLLFSQFSQYKIGLKKTSSSLFIKLNGEPISKQSQLARLTPLLVFDHHKLNIINGEPSYRRNLMDWCLFHVEHEYHRYWLAYQHALKQKNKLLKNPVADVKQLKLWNAELVKASSKIECFRRGVIEQLQFHLQDSMKLLMSEIKLELEYIKGWDRDSDLKQVLDEKMDSEIKRGFSLYGHQRDNISIFDSGHPVKEVLSGGQKKRSVIALLLSQLKIIKSSLKSHCLVLIDDLTAELDSDSIDRVLVALKELPVQTFITNVDPDIGIERYWQQYGLFHVEHGMITTKKDP